MVLRAVLTASFVAALAGCGHGPQAYAFTAIAPRSQAIDAVAMTLKKHGLNPEIIDHQRGTVTTAWFDSGYRFRETDDNRPLNFYTDIFLRHRVSVVDAHGILNMALKTDVQRCAPLDALVTATEVQGSCQPMDFLFPTQRREIEKLGKQLQEAVSAFDRRS
jgi:hypothetical protein